MTVYQYIYIYIYTQIHIMMHNIQEFSMFEGKRIVFTQKLPEAHG